MKASELRDLSERELAKRLDELREELFNFRFQVTVGQLENTCRLGEVRREIARVLTVQRERELDQEKEG